MFKVNEHNILHCVTFEGRLRLYNPGTAWGQSHENVFNYNYKKKNQLKFSMKKTEHFYC